MSAVYLRVPLKGSFKVSFNFNSSHKGSIKGLGFRSFRKVGVPYFGVLILRVRPFRVLSWGPLVSETPMSGVSEHETATKS